MSWPDRISTATAQLTEFTLSFSQIPSAAAASTSGCDLFRAKTALEIIS